MIIQKKDEYKEYSKIFSFFFVAYGAINRKQFWIAVIIYFMLLILLIGISPPIASSREFSSNFIGWFTPLILTYFPLAFGAKRLRDIGLSPWIIFLTPMNLIIVPFVFESANFYIAMSYFSYLLLTILVLGIVPGRGIQQKNTKNHIKPDKKKASRVDTLNLPIDDLCL